MKIGENAPDFTLKMATEIEGNLSDQRKNVVCFFIRAITRRFARNSFVRSEIIGRLSSDGRDGRRHLDRFRPVA
jgi:hypothetical protein